MGIAASLREKLFRQRSDGTAPFVLGRQRIFILPSRSGVLYAVTLLVMLTGAINYNLALGHALVFLLAGLGIVGMLHGFGNLYGLRISPGRCAPVFVGETALFQLNLANDQRQARLGLHLEALDGLAVGTAIEASDSTQIALPVPAGRRGWLELPRVRLWSRYPLGLFTAWAYLQPAMRCLVYPAPISVPLPHAGSRDADGDIEGDGGQDDFAGFRERQANDSLRHVAWKLSARDDGQRPLLIKQFAGGAQQRLQLDWAATDPTLPPETRLSVLCAWVLAADAGGDIYSLHLPDREIAGGRGEKHRTRCLEALALCAPEAG